MRDWCGWLALYKLDGVKERCEWGKKCGLMVHRGKRRGSF